MLYILRSSKGFWRRSSFVRRRAHKFSLMVLVLGLNYIVLYPYCLYIKTHVLLLTENHNNLKFRKWCMVTGVVGTSVVLVHSCCFVLLGGGRDPVCETLWVLLCWYILLKSYGRKKGSTRVHPQWAPAEEEALLRQEVTSLGETRVLSCLKVVWACGQVPP